MGVLTLWMTEPEPLSPATQAAFAGIELIAVAWMAYGALGLTQRTGPLDGQAPGKQTGRSPAVAGELFSRASGGLTLHQLRHSALTHLGEEKCRQFSF